MKIFILSLVLLVLISPVSNYFGSCLYIWCSHVKYNQNLSHSWKIFGVEFLNPILSLVQFGFQEVKSVSWLFYELLRSYCVICVCDVYVVLEFSHIYFDTITSTHVSNIDLIMNTHFIYYMILSIFMIFTMIWGYSSNFDKKISFFFLIISVKLFLPFFYRILRILQTSKTLSNQIFRI